MSRRANAPTLSFSFRPLPPTAALEEAYAYALENRWSGTRGEARTRSQCTRAIADLKKLGATTVASVTRDMLLEAGTGWASDGLTAATINSRLSALSVLGVDAKSSRASAPRAAKWWLRPASEAALLEALRTRPEPKARLLADYITFVAQTGLRVEEALRLEWTHIDLTRRCIAVPGTKTANSAAPIPVGDEVVGLLARRQATAKPGKACVFPIDYYSLREAWLAMCVPVLQASEGGDPSAKVLKALRRNAAHYLHVEKGMPLDYVRRYLRHGNVNTTIGYLNLAGDHHLEEMRRWL